MCTRFPFPLITAAILASTCLLAPPTSAQDADKELRDLKVKLTARAKSEEPENVALRTAATSILTQLARLDFAFKYQDYAQAQSSLLMLQRQDVGADLSLVYLEQVKEIEKRVAKLSVEMRDAWKVEVDTLIEEAREACLAAESDTELESYLARAVAAEAKNPMTRDAVSERTKKKLDGLIYALTTWMDYLVFVKDGNRMATAAILTALQKDTIHYPIIPREHLVEQTTSSEAASPSVELPALLKRLDSFEEVTASFSKLNALSKQSSIGDISRITKLQKSLTVFVAAGKHYDNGQIDSAFNELAPVIGETAVSKYNGGDYIPLLNGVRERLLGSVVPDYVALTIDADLVKANPINDDERPADYTLRLIDTVSALPDYDKLRKLLVMYSTLIPEEQMPAWVEPDINGLGSWLSAKYFDEAKDRFAAVEHYRAVVTTNGGKHAPLKAAADRLEALKKSDPEIFEVSDDRILHEIRQLRMGLQSRPPTEGYRSPPRAVFRR